MKKIKESKLANSRALTLVLLALAAVCLGVLSLWFACVDNRTAMFISYFTHPLIAVLNLLPVVFLALLLYFMTGRAGLSYGITAVLTLGLTAASFFKLTFRNDPMMFEDILLIKEAGNMAGKYQLFLNKSMLLAIVLVFLGWVVLHFLARGRMPLWPRLGGVAVLLMVFLPLQWLYADANTYTNRTRNEALISPWSATQVYTSKGFLYPFLYSVKSASDAPPEGYSAAAAQSILAAYEDADIPEEKRVDLIAIQLEAYNDFTKFGVPELNPAVYEEFHKLEAEGYTGNLVTNIFAGGTVDTERCFLTGYSRLGSFRAPTNSYAWYLQKQGYYTEGSHSCYAWFYNRENINANLGLQNYYYVENYYGALTGGGVGFDAVLFPEMIKLYDQHKETSDQPYFGFNVTYQGHGPYDTDVLWWGDGNSIYHLLGIDLDLSTKEGFLNYYATRYLIWANDAAREALGNDFRGEGPDLSPNFLMNEVFKLCGWEGPAYLQATNAVAEQVPVINTPTGLYLEDGVLTDALTPEGAALIQDYESLQYFWRKHFEP